MTWGFCFKLFLVGTNELLFASFCDELIMGFFSPIQYFISATNCLRRLQISLQKVESSSTFCNDCRKCRNVFQRSRPSATNCLAIFLFQLQICVREKLQLQYHPDLCGQTLRDKKPNIAQSNITYDNVMRHVFLTNLRGHKKGCELQMLIQNGE